MENGIGMETVAVGIGQLVSLGIVERQRGLKPAGHGVGQIGNQLPRRDGDDQLLPLACREPIAVYAAGHDLAVQRGRKRDVHERSRRGVSRHVAGLGFLPGSRLGNDLGRLLGELGQLADAKHAADWSIRGGQPNSRWPGSASGAMVTWRMTVSAMTGLAGLATAASFLRILAMVLRVSASFTGFLQFPQQLQSQLVGLFSASSV